MTSVTLPGTILTPMWRAQLEQYEYEARFQVWQQWGDPLRNPYLPTPAPTMVDNIELARWRRQFFVEALPPALPWLPPLTMVSSLTTSEYLSATSVAAPRLPWEPPRWSAR